VPLKGAPIVRSGSGQFRAQLALEDLAIGIARQRVPQHHAADALQPLNAFGCWDWWGYEGEGPAAP
jgi:hypothetical protein